MAEVLHYSRAGVQGPMLAAAPAVHPVVAPAPPPYAAWVPPSPNPNLGFALDAGVQHRKAEAFVGAAAAAAAELGDDQIGGAAAAYQKAAAQRAAERAVRPWDPVTGLGERRGAQMVQVAGTNAGPTAFARPDAPSLYHAPDPAAANAHAVAAGRVGRAGQDQGGAPGAYAVRQGAPQRELWPADAAQPQKYCTACRGGLLRCHPGVAPALAPYLRHLLPPLAVFRNHRAPMELPAPVCVAPTGTFAGCSPAPGASARSCRVCGAPVAREEVAAARRAAAEAALQKNASLLGAEAAADPDGALPPAAAKRLAGRECQRLTLAALIEEALGLMVGGGGELARRLVRSYIPSFTYYPPQHQHPYVVVDERGVPQPQQRRPSSAPRPEASPAATTARGGTSRRPQTASGRKAAARGRPAASAGSGSGGDGGGDFVVAPERELTAAELARWDGMEFKEQGPYGNVYGSPSGEVGADGQGQREPVRRRGSSGGGARRSQQLQQQQQQQEGPCLRVSTLSPVFDSPHDPLYGLLMAGGGAEAEAARRRVTYAHAGPEATRKGGAPRGGAGGGGGGGAGVRRVNINAEVPYKDSPAGLRRAF
ncbi:hypothetical protein TSOC_002623 [Tetrabaena socialis]|uniref:Uncharacterized protein n=1 Tax=Tetrabaena socialis TaxID=47790 RepID=A0A2J8ADR5_9CHLO|nr:hypothetical protein TSOC_002623 [Tetrabaena socialis]|eukprot:PNH10668.1 hypothetical protein TSOC_002623 [Tetrabaena socialis]